MNDLSFPTSIKKNTRTNDQQVKEKMLHIRNHYENAHQNHSKTPLMTVRIAFIKKGTISVRHSAKIQKSLRHC
jgi:hypothetical protein